MPALTEPRSGLQYGWNVGESGWKPGMDENLLRIGRFGFHPLVQSNFYNDPSILTPNPGDCYIVAGGGVNDWAGHDGEIACWEGTQWIFELPQEGRTFLTYEDQAFITYFLSQWVFVGIELQKLIQMLGNVGAPRTLHSGGIPMVVFGGDGSSGLYFTGSAGNFTCGGLNLAGFANAAGKGYMYLPDNWRGTGRPAGMYWYEMTADNTGKLFDHMYGGGVPEYQETPTDIFGISAGYITQPTTELFILYDLPIFAYSLGNMGSVETDLQVGGNLTGTKTFKLVGNYAPWLELVTSTLPEVHKRYRTQCQGFNNRWRTFQDGVGGARNNIPGYTYTYIDHSQTENLAFSVQLSTPLASAIIYSFSIDGRPFSQ